MTGAVERLFDTYPHDHIIDLDDEPGHRLAEIFAALGVPCDLEAVRDHPAVGVAVEKRGVPCPLGSTPRSDGSSLRG